MIMISGNRTCVPSEYSVAFGCDHSTTSLSKVQNYFRKRHIQGLPSKYGDMEDDDWPFVAVTRTEETALQDRCGGSGEAHLPDASFSLTSATMISLLRFLVAFPSSCPCFIAFSTPSPNHSTVAGR